MKLKSWQFLTLLVGLTLVSCGDTSSSLSLVQGDIAIDVLVSKSYNAAGHDLTGTVISLKDNPSYALFDLTNGIEPGLSVSQYIKIRSQSNYAIDYNAQLLLTNSLNGEVFFFRLIRLLPQNNESLIVDTTNIQYPENTTLSTPNFILASRGNFDIFHLSLTINPNLGNDYNLENPNITFAFSLLFNGQYLSESNS